MDFWLLVKTLECNNTVLVHKQVLQCDNERTILVK